MVVRRPPGSMLDWLRTPDPLNLVLCISEKYPQESQILPADPDPMEDPLSPLHMVLTCFVCHSQDASNGGTAATGVHAGVVQDSWPSDLVRSLHSTEGDGVASS